MYIAEDILDWFKNPRRNVREVAWNNIKSLISYRALRNIEPLLDSLPDSNSDEVWKIGEDIKREIEGDREFVLKSLSEISARKLPLMSEILFPTTYGGWRSRLFLYLGEASGEIQADGRDLIKAYFVQMQKLLVEAWSSEKTTNEICELIHLIFSMPVFISDYRLSAELARLWSTGAPEKRLLWGKALQKAFKGPNPVVRLHILETGLLIPVTEHDISLQDEKFDFTNLIKNIIDFQLGEKPEPEIIKEKQTGKLFLTLIKIGQLEARQVSRGEKTFATSKSMANDFTPWEIFAGLAMASDGLIGLCNDELLASEENSSIFRYLHEEIRKIFIEPYQFDHAFWEPPLTRADVLDGRSLALLRVHILGTLKVVIRHLEAIVKLPVEVVIPILQATINLKAISNWIDFGRQERIEFLKPYIKITDMLGSEWDSNILLIRNELMRITIGEELPVEDESLIDAHRRKLNETPQYYAHIALQNIIGVSESGCKEEEPLFSRKQSLNILFLLLFEGVPDDWEKTDENNGSIVSKLLTKLSDFLDNSPDDDKFELILSIIEMIATGTKNIQIKESAVSLIKDRIPVIASTPNRVSQSWQVMRRMVPENEKEANFFIWMERLIDYISRKNALNELKAIEQQVSIARHHSKVDERGRWESLLCYIRARSKFAN